jgi:S1-C subfamily serine protease
LTAYADLDDGGEMPTGVEVRSVDAGSAADAAGLAVGDVITSVDGVRIDTMDELVARLRRHSAGDVVSLTVGDGTTQATVRATLDDLAARGA